MTPMQRGGACCMPRLIEAFPHPAARRRSSPTVGQLDVLIEVESIGAHDMLCAYGRGML
jgi:hypothetical protein